jgi:luciferase family oxidoreductase group 1
MVKLAFLDLIPVRQGEGVSDALAHAAFMAQAAESAGFTRYWVAEHHGMEGIAGAATSLVISHLAAATTTIRVGSGGIMLPNHPPMVVAEQFGTLDALYPGRIDLGLGRAPGSDQIVARALRRPVRDEEQGFVQDIQALISLFADDGKTGVHATPGAGAGVSLYVLGSSLYGAYVAAALGLPYAFASHFAPAMLDEAIAAYRANFRPSPALSAPYVMAAMQVVVGDDDAEAEYLASSLYQSFVALRTGTPGKLPPPVDGYRESLPPQASKMLGHVLACSAIGGAETVATKVAAFVARTGVDELVVTSSVFDQEKRHAGLATVAEILIGTN